MLTEVGGGISVVLTSYTVSANGTWLLILTVEGEAHTPLVRLLVVTSMASTGD